MGCACESPECIHRMPCEGDLNKLKCLYKEYYARHAARLVVKVLDKVESRVDPFYRDTRTKDRIYKQPELVMSMFGPLDPYMFNQTFWGIDATRTLVFLAATPLLEDAGLVFKPGDLIVYQGAEHEVLTVKRKEDSFFDQWDYNFEMAVATFIPNRGS